MCVCVGGGGLCVSFCFVLVFRGGGGGGERLGERRESEELRDCVYMCGGVRVCACVDAGEYFCNALCIAL